MGGWRGQGEAGVWVGLVPVAASRSMGRPRARPGVGLFGDLP